MIKSAPNFSVSCRTTLFAEPSTAKTERFGFLHKIVAAISFASSGKFN
jgi:hypothetical protein